MNRRVPSVPNAPPISRIYCRRDSVSLLEPCKWLLIVCRPASPRAGGESGMALRCDLGIWQERYDGVDSDGGRSNMAR